VEPGAAQKVNWHGCRGKVVVCNTHTSRPLFEVCGQSIKTEALSRTAGFYRTHNFLAAAVVFALYMRRISRKSKPQPACQALVHICLFVVPVYAMSQRLSIRKQQLHNQSVPRCKKFIGLFI
jgi:hypothetical protein